MITVEIEGWRNITHSYALVNQNQIVELLKYPDIRLYHRDVPFYKPDWEPDLQIFPKPETMAINRLSATPAETDVDITYRIAFPYDLGSSTSKLTFVFGTSEYRMIPRNFVKDELPLMQSMIKNNIHIITPSHWSQQGFINSGAPEDRVHIVPHGIDTLTFRPFHKEEKEMARERMHLDKTFNFLSVGAMTGNKGIGFLLKSFALAAQQNPSTRLILKGNDSLYSSEDFLKQHTAHLSSQEMQSITSRIVYIGQSLTTSEMASLYNCADAYVSPYQAEGFNMPVLEAAACGIPVICTKGGATDDFVDQTFARQIESKLLSRAVDSGVHAFMLSPDQEHLNGLMIGIVDDHAFRAAAASAGPDFIRHGFTWEQVVARLVALFTNLLGRS